MKNILSVTLLLTTLIIFGCKKEEIKSNIEENPMTKPQKKVVYQVFTRLFGNTNTTNRPWGTLEENGVGKFADFDAKALKEIKDLGVTHIWYTGVPHHATVTDYTAYGISNDDPDVVKGRAGSPYAVKDYYNVNPDLAIDPEKRLEEFESLIQRSHDAGLNVIIDIVPNHVARKYTGTSNPKGIVDFGANDNADLVYDKNNNFYYVVGESFKVPVWENNYLPLGGEKHVLADGKFEENPAKWTGNGARTAQPGFYDWYETVKINYGINEAGQKDFVELPEGFDKASYQEHFDFWKDKDVPDSWKKFRDIALYWLDKGVDGFRYDMAEMVPVEFWSFMNSSIKMKNPDAFLLAEVYNPSLYRDYIFKGKMDYLYDKVALYDSIKGIMQGWGSTDHLPKVQDQVKDIEHNMLHFLENHDEQRIASPEFAGSALKGKPAMLVSATLSTSPTMIYFGQEVGEPGAENAGFGSPSRTSIFDYIGVPNHQRWMNNKKFDGGQLSESEKELRNFYKKLLNFTVTHEAMMGEYQEIHSYNREHTENYYKTLYSFVRWNENEKLIMVANFDENINYKFTLQIPKDIIEKWNLNDGNYRLSQYLDRLKKVELIVKNGIGEISIEAKPLGSYIFGIE